jgi:type IV pilus assembly protein PilA
MKTFCTQCGAQQDAAPASTVKCTACGQSFLVPGPKKTSTGAIVAMVVLIGGFGIVVIIGILAAIAIPNFLKFQTRSKQAEVRSNLKGMLNAEKEYFAEHDQYATSLKELGFAAERGNRYAYFLDVSGPMEDRSKATLTGSEAATSIGVDLFKFKTSLPITAADLPATVKGIGVTGQCPACSITLVGAGRLRDSTQLDVWSVSTASRQLHGRTVAAGELYNEVDGLK